MSEWQNDITNTALAALKKYILEKQGDRYRVNFDENLKMLIREAKYMRSELPPTILNIALQEDKYHQYID